MKLTGILPQSSAIKLFQTKMAERWLRAKLPSAGLQPHHVPGQYAMLNTIANSAAFFFAGLALVLLPSAAFGGTGGTAEFGTVYTTIEGWFQGTLGKTIALSSLGVGLGMGVVKQSVMAIVLGVSMGLGIYYGPTIIDSIVVAVI
jgi:conjugal transfer pilus assembly protein TraA